MPDVLALAAKAKTQEDIVAAVEMDKFARVIAAVQPDVKTADGCVVMDFPAKAPSHARK